MGEEDWDTPAKVEELRAAGTAGGLDPLFRDDGTLRRFLRARRGDVNEALKMLLK
jgi:hypothetical protein